jgi:hypothetical protein
MASNKRKEQLENLIEYIEPVRDDFISPTP